MRFPTPKSLQQIHDADHALMRKLGKATRAELLMLSPAAAQCDHKSFNPHKTSTLRLEALNEAARTHGVEYAHSTKGEYLSYLNAGDMYTPTVIYWRGAYRVATVGDMIESLEKRSIHFD